MKRDLAQVFIQGRLNREHPNIAKRYISKMDIFELKNYPGLIFKSDRRGDRSNNRLKSLKIITQYGLDRLVIPDAISFSIEVDNSSIKINVEEKLELTGLFQETKDAYLALFSRMATEPELHEQLEVLFSQLAIFAYETGFWDVGYSNIPLLINSEIPKIVLVDLNDLFDENSQKFLGYKKEAILGLLERFHKDFHKTIVNSAAKHSGSTPYAIMHKISTCDYDKGCSYNKPYSFKDVFLRYENDGMF